MPAHARLQSVRTISVAALRRLVVTAQGYVARARRASAEEVESAIRRASCIQLDSISAVERSHRVAIASRGAGTRMNQCLGSTHLPQGLRRTTAVSSSGVGYYLRTEGTVGRPRFEVFFGELAEIAHILARKPGPRPVICL